ncbi:serine carboxypeptidase-like 3 [Carex littledalei]|uniref:Serine carboxypeptidase-like 3 n=1 Tax=Carex littledalei TaxID=544730 RepID=A0A833V5T4_9POAL|nr:serine carboxypeptidase-like 3 [Carex littledalei]
MVDEVNGGELFYYFIESEGNPSKDPLLLWLTGGSRCSALSGLIFEIGPLKIVKAPYNGSIPELEYDPYAWTQNASIIFLDSPLGAGFSYSSNPKGYEVGETVASSQIHKFLMQWVVDHPHYLAHPFYVAGDSYAGKIVPFVAQLISEGVEARQQQQLNLKGYMVGNPVTGEKNDVNSRVPYAHGHGIISDQLFELRLEVSEAHILEPHCILVSPATKDIIPNRRFLKDDYSIRLSKPEEPPFYCRSYSYYLSYFWANDNATREALGIKKGTKKEWQRCTDLPYERDINSTIKYHHNLTSKGYRALVYSGDHDMLVPFLGTQAWVRSLNFPVMDAWRAWRVDGQTAG